MTADVPAVGQALFGTRQALIDHAPDGLDVVVEAQLDVAALALCAGKEGLLGRLILAQPEMLGFAVPVIVHPPVGQTRIPVFRIDAADVVQVVVRFAVSVVGMHPADDVDAQIGIPQLVHGHHRKLSA